MLAGNLLDVEFQCIENYNCISQLFWERLLDDYIHSKG